MFSQDRIVSKGLAVAAAAWFAASLAAIPANAADGEGKGQQPGQMKCGGSMPATENARCGSAMQGSRCGSGMDHSKHMAMMNKTGYERSEHQYELPDLALVNEAGEEVPVRSVLEGDETVMVNFIFTTCTTICPVMSATFAQVREELGPESANVRMVSISIDPEHDTPERLREYAQRYQAGPGWVFLTGSLDDSIAVQKAFDVYRGNKMNHEPTTLMKTADGDTWIRIDGLASAADIASEYRRLVGQ